MGQVLFFNIIIIFDILGQNHTAQICLGSIPGNSEIQQAIFHYSLGSPYHKYNTIGHKMYKL